MQVSISTALTCLSDHVLQPMPVEPIEHNIIPSGCVVMKVHAMSSIRLNIHLQISIREDLLSRPVDKTRAIRAAENEVEFSSHELQDISKNSERSGTTISNSPEPAF